MNAMIRRNLQRAIKKNTGSVFFLTATLLLIPWTEPARAHIADGENVLTDWHWRWDVIFVLGIFARTHVNVERFRLRISPRDQDNFLSEITFFSERSKFFAHRRQRLNSYSW